MMRTETGANINLNQLWFGACTRCDGTLQLSQDQIGYFRHCLNCARETEVPATAKATGKVAAGR